MTLHYDEPLFRPPSEAKSLILQVTLGCSWNRCSFCEMYTSKKFKPRPWEEIQKDIESASRSRGKAENIFLADGDALVLTNPKLLPILQKVSQKFSKLKRITSYATPQNILRKSLTDLKALHQAGLTMIYLGVETGDPVVLNKIDKGASYDDILKAMLKAREAGLKVSTTNLLGVGGKKYSEQHAKNTAKLLSEGNPDYISFLTLMFPLGRDRFLGKFGDDFEELNQKELLEELKVVVEHLNPQNSEFRSNHASNYLALKAHLPQDKEKLLGIITQTLNNPDSGLLRTEDMRGL
jgi:radical SAM superfamily enzyme YgiQ (UPF0313 family)